MKNIIARSLQYKFYVALLCVLGILCNFYSCSTLSHDYTNYYYEVHKSDSLFKEKKFVKAFRKLDSLFSVYEPLNTSSVNEYFIYSKLTYLLNKSNHKETIIKSVTDYGLNPFYFGHDSLLFKAYKKAKLSTRKYNIYREKYLNSIDLSLREEIKTMKGLDQKYRGYDNSTASFSKRKKSDTENQRKLKELFNKNIFPNNKVIGDYSIDKENTDVIVLLLHTNDSIRTNFFLPRIKKFVESGKCEPIIYAAMVDQFNLYNGKEQFYGTYNILRIAKKDYRIFNKRRKTIGLPSIEMEVSKLNKLLK